MRRAIGLLLLSLSVAVAAYAQVASSGDSATGLKARRVFTGNCQNIDTVPCTFRLDAFAHTAATSSNLSLVGYGGSPSSCTLEFKECPSATPGTCSTVLSAAAVISAVDTNVTGTYSDTSWASGAHMRIEYVSGTCPTVVQYRVQAIASP